MAWAVRSRLAPPDKTQTNRGSGNGAFCFVLVLEYEVRIMNLALLVTIFVLHSEDCKSMGRIAAGPSAHHCKDFAIESTTAELANALADAAESGWANRYPCPWSQPASLRILACAAVSTPSAMMVRSRAFPCALHGLTWVIVPELHSWRLHHPPATGRCRDLRHHKGNEGKHDGILSRLRRVMEHKTIETSPQRWLH